MNTQRKISKGQISASKREEALGDAERGRVIETHEATPSASSRRSGSKTKAKLPARIGQTGPRSKNDVVQTMKTYLLIHGSPLQMDWSDLHAELERHAAMPLVPGVWRMHLGGTCCA